MDKKTINERTTEIVERYFNGEDLEQLIKNEIEKDKLRGDFKNERLP